jgi:hypothetical protein
MPRNRMIKPEFWNDEKLVKISRDARLFFIGIWNFSDDYGFILDSNRFLLGDIFPFDETVNEELIQQWKTELIKGVFLIPFEYKGKKLLFVKSWCKHQTVQHPSKRMYVNINDLDEVLRVLLKSHENLMRVYLDSHDPKRKKKEKEKEKEK